MTFGGPPSITARDAAAAQAEGALIVDVRERDEFTAERVAGAALVPISEFLARRDALPKDQPLLMICASGNRSGSATAYLLQNGWTDVRNVTGGMLGWRMAGLPTRSGPIEPGEGELPG